MKLLALPAGTVIGQPTRESVRRFFDYAQGALIKADLALVAVEANDLRHIPDPSLIGPQVGAQIKAQGLGEFDSEISFQSQAGAETSRWHFFVPRSQLAKALQALRRELEKLNVLPCVKIAHLDDQLGSWRVFHPGTVAEASQGIS